MMWDVWDSVFHDDTANMALYDLVGGRGLSAEGNVIHLGDTELIQARGRKYPIEAFLRPKMSRYRDVDISLKVEIIRTTKTDGANENLTHWFGIAARAIRADHWDAYLFYIRKDGRVEFGIRRRADAKPPLVSLVSSQLVTVRVTVEGNRVQTWVNGTQHHEWIDDQKEFIRSGDIYLIAYGSLVAISDVEIRVKRWYAPMLRFVRHFWKWLSAIVGVIAVAFSLYETLPRLREILSRMFSKGN